MNINYSPVKSGKTTQIIKDAAKSGGYIVCPRMEDCKRIFQMAKELGEVIHYPLTAHEFATRDYNSHGVKSIHIDDADSVLQAISMVPIKGISLTEEAEI